MRSKCQTLRNNSSSGDPQARRDQNLMMRRVSISSDSPNSENAVSNDHSVQPGHNVQSHDIVQQKHAVQLQDIVIQQSEVLLPQAIIEQRKDEYPGGTSLQDAVQTLWVPTALTAFSMLQQTEQPVEALKEESYDVLALLDTGSNVTAVSQEVSEQLQLDHLINQTETTATKSASGHPIQTSGAIFLNSTALCQTLRLKCEVFDTMPAGYDIILGSREFK